MDFQLCQGVGEVVSTPNPHIVQGSTVHIKDVRSEDGLHDEVIKFFHSLISSGMFGKQDPITLYQLSSWLNHFVFRGKNPKTKMK